MIEFMTTIAFVIIGIFFLACAYFLKLLIMKSNFALCGAALLICINSHSISDFILAVFIFAAAYLSEHSAKINLAFSTFAGLVVSYGVVGGLIRITQGFSVKCTGIGILVSFVLAGISLAYRYYTPLDRPREYVPVVSEPIEDVFASIVWGCCLFIVLQIITCDAAFLNSQLAEIVIVAVGAATAYFLDRKLFELIEKVAQEDPETAGPAEEMN